MSHYIIVDRDRRVVRIEDEYHNLQGLPEHLNWINNWDVGTFDEAVRIAEEASKVMGKKYLPIDRTASVSPRFGIVEAPRVGDPVSYGFNGDYYPCGHITKISDSYYRIQTSTGDVFYHRGHTGSWVKKGGTWSLVSGHINERNPSF